jgi:hypothetical protein
LESHKLPEGLKVGPAGGGFVAHEMAHGGAGEGALVVELAGEDFIGV